MYKPVLPGEILFSFVFWRDSRSGRKQLRGFRHTHTVKEGILEST